MESDLSETVDALPGLVWTAFPDGRAEFVNRGWREYTGLSLEQVSGAGWQAAVHPEDLPFLLDSWFTIIASAQPGEAQARLRRFDGVYRWFLFRASPMTDSAGQVIKWCGINTDIENHKRDEASIRTNAQHFRLVVDMLPTRIVLVTPEGELDHANRHTLEYSGMTAKEYKASWAAGELVHPDDRQTVAATISASLGSGMPYDSESRHTCANGIYRWLRVQGFPLRDEEAQIVLWLFLQTDIDDRKQADERLRKSAVQMTKAQQLSSCGSFYWCPETDGMSWSDELYRIFGVEPGASVTLDMVTARALPSDAHIVDRILEQAREGKELDCEYRVSLPNGSIKYVLMQAHAIHDPHGRVEYIGAVQDVTARRQSEDTLNSLQAELAHASRVNSLGALTASIAHEINQPLAGIVTNASTGMRMLNATPPDVEGALEMLRRTLRDGHRASDVIGRLHSMFKKEVLASAPVDLGEAALEVIRLLRVEMLRKRISLQLDIAHDLPAVTGDRIQLQQVMLNLLMNAVEATRDVDDDQKQILLKIEREDATYARLTVTDSGVGFDLQHAARLFDPFYTTKAGGLGVGLSVCRCIIDRHGGSLWASGTERSGATFAFRVPFGGNPAAAGDSSLPGGNRQNADAAHTVRHL
jgi:PAS domain S-box-containing protein